MKRSLLILLLFCAAIASRAAEPATTVTVVSYNGKKYGIVDLTTGRVIAPCIYDEFMESGMTARKGDRYGLVDLFGSGRELTPFIYSMIDGSSWAEYITAAKGEHYGLLDRATGREVTPFKYSDIQWLEETLWQFTEADGTRRIVDMLTGKEPFTWEEYDRRRTAATIPPRSIVRVGDKAALQDNRTSGYIIPPDWNRIEGYRDTYYKVVRYAERKPYPGAGYSTDLTGKVISNQFYEGLLDSTGRAILPCTYDRVELRWAPNYNDKRSMHLFRVCRANKWGVVDARTGTFTVPCIWDGIYGSRDGYARVTVYKDGDMFMGLVNITTGAVTIPAVYERLEGLDSPYRQTHDYVLAERGERFGIFDSVGHAILEPVWDMVTPLWPANLHFVAVKDAKRALYDAKGRQVLPPVYDQIYFVSPQDIEAPEKKNNLYLLTERDGRQQYLDYTTLAPVPSFEAGGRAHLFSQSPLLIKDKASGLYGVADGSTGKMILPFEYVQGDRLGDYLMLYPSDQVSTSQTVVFNTLTRKTFSLPPGDALVLPYDMDGSNLSQTDGLFDRMLVERGGKYGIYDLRAGKVLLAPAYDEITLVPGTVNAVVRRANRWGIVEPGSGRMVLPLQYEQLTPTN